MWNILFAIEKQQNVHKQYQVRLKNTNNLLVNLDEPVNNRKKMEWIFDVPDKVRFYEEVFD